MLDAGVIQPSNSPWCNVVVLVRKKDGSLRFCIDFRKLNSLTVKDSHLLPRICETLESLAGAAHYPTFDMNSGFRQVPMDKESKQYTAFTLGSMGLYECESMPLQTTFSSFYARCFCWFSCSEVCAGLGNGCERCCTSRSLLGSYVHQESI